MKISSAIARILIAMIFVGLGPSAGAQSASLAPAAGARRDGPVRSQNGLDQRARAIERCKANRGVDCDTAQGLEEWLLQERTRADAVAAGSRHRAPGAIATTPRR